jgi:NADPH-dependent 2,4-dienoyl-CoA reductase/sulfur reductase-like enzyme
LDSRTSTGLDTEVLVIGGGAAGVAAAITAARKGMKVTLVERYGFCGGGAVAGLSGTVCGLYEATDDRSAAPKQVVYGFADEFCSKLEANGGLAAPVLYGKTWTRVHDPLIWRETADAMLREAGVQIVFHAVAKGVHLNGDKVEGLDIWT